MKAPSPRALFGWSPPRLPADTPAKRRVDQVLPSQGLAAVLFVAAVIALLAVAAYLPQRPALVLDGVAAGASGLWCAANFWRCRHAHCLVTGAGWSLLGLCYLAEAGLGHSFVAGYEQPIFLGVLVVGLLFEGYWTVRYGSNAVSCGFWRYGWSGRGCEAVGYEAGEDRVP